MGRLCIPEGVDAQLRACWAGVAAGSGGSLYGSYQEFRELVEQVCTSMLKGFQSFRCDCTWWSRYGHCFIGDGEVPRRYAHSWL